MADQPFFKFPSTPHLTASSGVSRADKLLPEAERALLLSGAVTVEEKIDGANLGISFSRAGDVLLQNRGQYLLPPYLGQWTPLPAWLAAHGDRLFDVLEDRYILFGEWCCARHSLHYTALPDWFLAFDVYDTAARKFLSVPRRDAAAARAGVSVVPLLRHGRFALEDIPALLRQSAYGDCPCEGLYLRRDEDGWLRVRAKYVRSTFSQTIDRHWRGAPFQKNRLRA